MKTRLSHIIAASFTAGLVASVFALEAPADNAAPPAAAAEVRDAKPAAPAKPAEKAEVAFLGVGTTEIPDILAEHLNLKPEAGVLVNSLQPDSPAAKAGIVVNDIITRIAGQRVASTLEVGEKVRSCKPGETIRLDVIHKGKPTSLDIALGSRPEEPEAMQAQEDVPDAQAAPVGDMHDRIRDMRKRIGAMELQIGGLGNQGAQGMGKIRIHNGASVRMMDNNGSVELKSNNDGKEVTVRDPDDKVTWSGPWDTEQDKAAAPADIRQRIERLNIVNGNRNGFRFNMGMGGIIPQPDLNGDEDHGAE